MSAVDAAALTAWVREFARLVHEQRDALTQLDAAIGDADHGANLDRGMTAAVAALEATPSDDPAAVLKTVATTLIKTVGGASGPLYGTFFLRLGSASGTVTELSPDDFAKGLRAGLDGLVARGKPELGDKTMYDALHPALEALEAALAGGNSSRDAFDAAAAACRTGRDATTAMVARKGRASYLGERSAGHQDPGATSAALLLDAAAAVLSS
jgi:phosphoenolpyruvate---glycerone phosphotransferase subunit DhaL